MVNERSQALKERDQTLQEKADLQKTLADQVSQITQITTERDKLKTKGGAVKQDPKGDGNQGNTAAVRAENHQEKHLLPGCPPDE
ncbi:hypothetical protein Desor_5162 [Desulfosporosinus orientis DSM 765]|uniref:Uncharacterized protein n=1 Tax=Desulfosporosinus orientis (strain ATCC 19365 / DSM 765 / NCIMB 8382 / VKM B-1628 / Singapore I) TaxID=768706 RepID=G7W742_DESOD|nr:hypothetical protein [Desulfosporosinus orientis]AET70550.1 hypothetical protein Desor_5162 [Desulfosporosinus orientis DSM 765]